MLATLHTRASLTTATISSSIAQRHQLTSGKAVLHCQRSHRAQLFMSCPFARLVELFSCLLPSGGIEFGWNIAGAITSLGCCIIELKECLDCLSEWRAIYNMLMNFDSGKCTCLKDTVDQLLDEVYLDVMCKEQYRTDERQRALWWQSHDFAMVFGGDRHQIPPVIPGAEPDEVARSVFSASTTIWPH
jgi:hypothetical protein